MEFVVFLNGHECYKCVIAKFTLGAGNCLKLDTSEVNCPEFFCVKQ